MFGVRELGSGSDKNWMEIVAWGVVFLAAVVCSTQ